MWVQSAITGTTATALLALEAPTTLTLSADPPEDITVLRIVGEFLAEVSATSHWVMALVVQDATWTPSSTFGPDADKRILWSTVIHAVPASTPTTWNAGLVKYTDAAGNEKAVQTAKTFIDIAPKVKVEAGKTLYLVAYEQTGSATFTTTTQNMRMLFQRSGRR